MINIKIKQNELKNIEPLLFSFELSCPIEFSIETEKDKYFYTTQLVIFNDNKFYSIVTK